jgi:hypothetical protein
LWADSIVTNDLAALAAHPVLRCYDFHGDQLLVNRPVLLNHGVEGEDYVYQNSAGTIWHTLTWEWPVAGPSGQVRYERMVLMASSNAPTKAQVPEPHSDSLFASSVLSLLNLLSTTNHDPNEALSNSVIGAADRIIDARLNGARP